MKPTLVLTFAFDARQQRVFDVCTQAEHLQKWLAPDVKIDLQVGGAFSTSDGDKGKFLKVAVPRQLVFSYGHPNLALETEVDVTFSSPGPLAWTEIRIVHKGLDPKQVDVESYAWLNDHWQWLAHNLKRYLDRRGRVVFEQWRARRQPVFQPRP